jgi:hypothetical protein
MGLAQTHRQDETILNAVSKVGFWPLNLQLAGNEPEIKLADCNGLKTKELRRIEKLLLQNRDLFITAWHQYFNEK